MAVVPAARRRIGLAGYLDYLVLGVPLAWLMWLYAWVNPGLDRLPWAVKLISFLVLEVLLVRQVRWSPGSKLLGISVLTPTALEEGSQETLAGRRFVVDAHLKREERWWTLLLGVFLVLDGAKAFTRWMWFVPPTHVFCIEVSSALAPSVLVVEGAIAWVIAWGVLRLRPWPVLGGAVYMVVSSVSEAVAWPILPELIARYIVLRRASQGLTVKAGEVETMQAFMPYALVIAPAVIAVWLVLVALRARSSRRSGAASMVAADRLLQQ
jgi:hypothetical protein